jgi:hypothetical protein
LIDFFIWHSFRYGEGVANPAAAPVSLKEGTAMNTITISRSALVCALLAAATLAPSIASASEGGWRSAGQGIKCITQAVVQADGTVKYQQVCVKRG